MLSLNKVFLSFFFVHIRTVLFVQHRHRLCQFYQRQIDVREKESERSDHCAYIYENTETSNSNTAMQMKTEGKEYETYFSRL